jgi:glycosyltransferase involved in cell wall biosynthesis
MNVKYVIISPVRNEEKNIEKTIQSVINQTIKPVEWIIVNDGSSDRTVEIISECCKKYEWIKLLNKKDEMKYQLGSNVVDCFYLGLNSVKSQYEYIVKMDGDLSFEDDYFEFIFMKFNEMPHLGMASGQSYVPNGSTLIWEDTPEDHVKGLLCTYKRECFEDIGGLISSLGWDTVDEVKAREKGWMTRSFREKMIIHYRPLGSRTGMLKGNIRHGHIAYIVGRHPLYVLLRCLYRLFDRPYILGAFFYCFGYFHALLTRQKKIINKETEKFFKKEQFNKIVDFKFYRFYKNKFKN